MKLSLILLVSSFVLCTCSGLQAQTATESASSLSSKIIPHQIGKPIDAATRSNMLAKTGGLAQAPFEPPAVLFLNVQRKVAAETLSTVPDQVQKVMRLCCSFESKFSSKPVDEALNALVNSNVAAVVVIADCAGYPSLLIAPENRWALVNIAALVGPNVSDKQLGERAEKEVWRAFGYLMGAANSNFEYCLLKPVLSPTDLDALKPKSLCPEPFSKILLHAQKLGMKPARRGSYRKAVEEGWAPAPTNDIQRAIWQELRK